MGCPIGIHLQFLPPAYNLQRFRKAGWKIFELEHVNPDVSRTKKFIAALELAETHVRMTEANLPPIIHAAVVAWGFLFLHPFEDGNGRIHRFLIHNILSMRGVVPEGLMFPVSAVMLKNPADYDASLEAFSRPLKDLIDYRLDGMGRMTVQNDTACWYRYMDMTDQAEALYDFIEKTIEEELPAELNFLKA